MNASPAKLSFSIRDFILDHGQNPNLTVLGFVLLYYKYNGLEAFI